MSERDMKARLRALERELQKTEKLRDKWSAKAAEIEKTLRAYKLVLEDLGEDTAGGEIGSNAAGLTESVRNSVIDWQEEEEFTPDDLRQTLPPELQGVPTSSITHALKRMMKDDKPILEVVEVGAGKRQSRYRRLSENPPREEDSGVTPFIRRVAGEG